MFFLGPGLTRTQLPYGFLYVGARPDAPFPTTPYRSTGHVEEEDDEEEDEEEEEMQMG